MASVSEDEGEVIGWRRFGRRGEEASRHWCSAAVPSCLNEWNSPFDSYCRKRRKPRIGLKGEDTTTKILSWLADFTYE
jgi:hypothetical protein